MENVSIMHDIETLLRTVYTMFSRSFVKKGKLEEELAKVTEYDVSFRLLNDVQWLSRHFAVSALIRNYDILTQYCKETVDKCSDPISKYCIKVLTNPQYEVVLNVLNDVLEELASLCKFLQKSCLNTI